MRLSIEFARTGYLYVVNREEYKGGSWSEPYLIYPNYLTRSGGNLLGQAG